MTTRSDPARETKKKRTQTIDAVVKGEIDPRESVNQELSLARRDPKEDYEAKERPLDWGLITRLFTFTGQHASKRNALFAIVVLRGIQLPVLAWMLGEIIRGPIASGNVSASVWSSAGFLAFAFFTQLTMHFRTRYALELGESVVRDLRNAVYQHLMRMPMSYFNKTRLGRNISRMTSDIEALRVGVQNVFFVSMVQILQGLIAGIFMLFTNWQLFSVVLAMAPVIWGLNRFFRGRISRASRATQESFSRITASLAESVKGIQVTQGFVRENVNAGIFRRLVEDHSQYSMGLARHSALLIPLLELNSQFFMASILLIGGYGTLHGGMEVGDLITFVFLANLFFQPFTVLGQQFTAALAAMAGAERVFGLLDREPEWQDPPDAIELPPIQGRVEFKDLHFHYNPEKPVLKGITFEVDPGQTCALVGHTGSGKTTIINLVSKFYLPVQGQILIDGYDITKVTSKSLHQQIGVVLQSNFLFTGDVMENIRLGKLDATDEEVEDAARKIGCLDLFEALPDGLRTHVGERGSGLSLGQQQLVCFARAMLADPRILILDEATSSVDTITEARLQAALENLLRNRTSFVIAHRLSTIRKADMCLVLDHGEIVERGTHATLLEKGGIYAGLYRQFVEG